MGVWREKRAGTHHSLPLGPYRAHVVMSGDAEDAVRPRFFRYVGDGPVPMFWRPSADNCVEMDLETPTDFPDLQKGEQAAREVLERLVGGLEVEGEFAYRPVDPPRLVESIEHSSKLLLANLLQWPTRFEIRVIGYVPTGYTIPVATPAVSFDPDYDWGRLDLFESLYADSLEEARVAAVAELGLHASSEAPIMDRPL